MATELEQLMSILDTESFQIDYDYPYKSLVVEKKLGCHWSGQTHAIKIIFDFSQDTEEFSGVFLSE